MRTENPAHQESDSPDEQSVDPISALWVAIKEDTRPRRPPQMRGWTAFVARFQMRAMLADMLATGLQASEARVADHGTHPGGLCGLSNGALVGAGFAFGTAHLAERRRRMERLATTSPH